jgi:signal transduction histidine kinase/ligand-binding sensor domain-containing protein
VCAFGVDPNRTISQYSRDRWGEKNGFPAASVTAITQTADGYLWIGTEKGLVRFDGQNFRLVQQATPELLSIGPVLGLLTDAQSNLWILLPGTRVLRFRDGKFESGRGKAEFGITAIGKRRNGAVLFSSVLFGVLTFDGEKFDALAPSIVGYSSSPSETANGPDDLSSRFSWAPGVASHHLAEPYSAAISLAETDDGKLWLGTNNNGLFYSTNGQLLAVQSGGFYGKITCLLPLGHDHLWVGTDKGVVDWNGSNLSQASVPSDLRHIPIHTMLRDHDSNIWVGTQSGLMRVNGHGISFEHQAGRNREPVTALFEDRESNIWVGCASGIERLRDSAFITYSAGGLLSKGGGPIYADEQGRVWFSPLDGGLHWLKDGTVTKVPDDGLHRDVVYSIAGGSDGLWIGRQQGGLTHLYYQHGSIRTRTYTQVDGLLQDAIYAVYEARDGTVWSGSLSGGVSALRSGHFTNYTTATGLPSNTVSSIVEDTNGTIWVGTPSGLAGMTQNRWRAYSTGDGLPSEDVNCLLADSNGILWIGTANGLAFLSDGRIQVPHGVREPLTEPIYGISEDRKGWLWIATAHDILEIKEDSLIRGELNDLGVREYTPADGLLATEGVKRSRSVVEDMQGRIWFSTTRGISVVDPSQIVDSPSVVAKIELVQADNVPLAMAPRLRIPPSRKRISFGFSGVSLEAPERVRFRYFLDGFDRGWGEPVSGREAVYTNLGPGFYRFRLIACNKDGRWNDSETSVSFEVEPALWQTRWFRALCTLLVIVMVSAAYSYRSRQIARQFELRLEERVSERTRIARELHDTLLQSFQGLLLRFQSVANLLPTRPEDAKQRLDDTIEYAAKAITEGRDAVRQLRSITLITNDLASDISLLAGELGVDYKEATAPNFSMQMEGTARNLHPIVRDEVYRIAAESVRNAFKHSGAKNVEVELRYGERELRLRTRDDGRGIDPAIPTRDRVEGHWGLSGMRERAKLLGGTLEVWSEVESGTEVQLIIPAAVAYTARSAWYRRLFSSRRAA